MNAINWKYEYPLDPSGRVSFVGRKVWVGRVGGEPVCVVWKDGGQWKSSGKGWHGVSETKEEAIAKCEERASK